MSSPNRISFLFYREYKKLSSFSHNLIKTALSNEELIEALDVGGVYKGLVSYDKCIDKVFSSKSPTEFVSLIIPSWANMVNRLFDDIHPNILIDEQEGGPNLIYEMDINVFYNNNDSPIIFYDISALMFISVNLGRAKEFLWYLLNVLYFATEDKEERDNYIEYALQLLTTNLDAGTLNRYIIGSMNSNMDIGDTVDAIKTYGQSVMSDIDTGDNNPIEQITGTIKDLLNNSQSSTNPPNPEQLIEVLGQFMGKFMNPPQGNNENDDQKQLEGSSDTS